jgi:hypothetical protein
MGMSSADAAGDGYALAYREARVGLEDQERLVTDLRARAGTLIAAAAITTSFFAGQALVPREISVAAWVAIGCFTSLGFVVLSVLWPRRDWEFSPSPDQLIATYIEPVDADPLEPSRIQRDLAVHMGHSAELNGHQLRSLTTRVRIAVLLLVVEVLAWLVALGVQR